MKKIKEIEIEFFTKSEEDLKVIQEALYSGKPFYITWAQFKQMIPEDTLIHKIKVNLILKLKEK